MDTPSPQIKAIETIYDGNRFRSRLEARWACFFNALSIPYEYEPEGFELHGIRYLPDFWLPDHKFFFEVKGPFTDNNGVEKAIRLATSLRKMVYLFGGIPNFSTSGLYDGEGTAYYPDDGVDYDYMWCRKKCCGKLGIQYHGRSSRIQCDCHNRNTDDTECTVNDPRLLMAYIRARHAQFERGGK